MYIYIYICKHIEHTDPGHRQLRRRLRLERRGPAAPRGGPPKKTT